MTKPKHPLLAYFACTLKQQSFRAVVVFGLFLLTLPLFSYTRALLPASLTRLGLGSQTAYAATNDTLNFQARLETGAGAIAGDGYYNVQFKLYDASTGGTLLWTETRAYNTGAGACSGPLGTNDCRVRVANGYLTVDLGSLTSFPSTIPWDQQLYLTMNIGGTVTAGSYPGMGDGEMTPRLKLTAVPYAMNAKTASQIATSYSGNLATLSISNPTSGNQTFQIQDQGAAGTYNILTAPNGSDGYVKLQPGSLTQQTGGLSVSGNAIVGGLLQGNTLEAGSAQQFQVDASGNVNTSGSIAGGSTLTLGVASAANGTIVLKNSTNAHTVSVLSAAQTGDYTATVPVLSANDTFCMQSLSNCAANPANFIQNQNASAQATANFWISGTGQASSFTVGTNNTSTGTVVFNTAGSTNTVTISSAAQTTGSYTLSIPLLSGNADICTSLSNCALSAGSNYYIQNQNGSDQSADFRINGTGQANVLSATTSVQTPLVDTATAVALSIGTTNATSINLNQDTVLAAGQSITITGGNTASRPASPTEGMVYYDTTTKQLLTYANGKWQADRTTATKIVGTSASGGTSGAVASQNPDAAEYVNTSATSAQTVINSAITALGTQGGTVYLMEGTYVIDGSITMSSKVTLIGAGSGTVIKLKNGINASIDAISVPSKSNVIISNLYLDGNKANNTAGNQNGISATLSGSATLAGTTISNTTISSFRRYGIEISLGKSYVITGNTIFSSGDSGMYIGAATEVNVTANTVSSNVGCGIEINASSSSFSGNTLRANASGICVQGANDNVISDNTISGSTSASGSGIDLWSAGNHNIISNNVVSGGAYWGISVRTGSSNTTVTGNVIEGNEAQGIFLTLASYNKISGNKLYNNTGSGTSSSIDVTSGSEYNTVENNYITDTAGTGYAIRVNNGSYVSNGNVLSGNYFSGTGATAISDAATGTVFAGQAVTAGGLDIRFKQANSMSAFQVQNGNGTNVINVDTTNGVFQLGSYNGGTNAVAGKLAFGTTSNANVVTIQATAQTGNYTLSIPALTANDTLCLQTLNNCGGLTATTGIQNQYTSAQSSANFWIDGTGRADTAILTPSLDTAAAGTLTIAGTNATTVNIANNNAAHTTNIGTGAAAQAITIGSQNTTSGLTLQAGTGGITLNNASGGSLTTKINGNNVFTIDSTGRSVFTPTADTAATFAVTNAAGTTLFGVNADTGSTWASWLNVQSQINANRILIDPTYGGQATMTSPLGASVDGAIAIKSSSYGGYAAGIYLGLTSGAPTTSRGIAVFDARAGAQSVHQPTIGIISPDENQIGGFSYDGSNTTLKIKNSSTDIALNVNGFDALTVKDSGAGDALAVLGVGSSKRGQLSLLNASNNNYVILQPSATSTSYFLSLPSALGSSGDCLYDTTGTGVLGWKTCDGLTSTTGIQNQYTSAQSSANFWIQGTGRADTALLTPSLDTAAAGTLAIGGTNATTVNIANNNAGHTINIATGTGNQNITIGNASGTGATIIRGGTGGVLINPNDNFAVTLGGNGFASIQATASHIANRLSSNSTYQVTDAASGDMILQVDNLGGANTVSTGWNSNLYVAGSATFDSGLTITDGMSLNYTTPLGYSLSTAINIPNYSVGAFDSIIALGLPGGSAATARGILVADARSGATSVHQPTIGILSPDEGQIGGFSYDGTNTTLYVKNTADNIALQANNVNLLTAAKSGTDVLITLGVIGTNAGKLTFANSTTSGSVSIVSGAQTGNYTATIPVLAVNDTFCMASLNNCNSLTTTTGIQNQNAAQQTGANFWIQGTGRADTSILTPLLDTATAVALNIGTTNATSINLNQNTTIASGKNLTVTSGTTSLTGTTNINTTGATTTTIGNASATNNINGANTILGATTINTTGTATTAIGNSTGTLQLTSNTFTLSTAGAVTGATGITMASGNFLQNGTGTFGTGTGLVSLNGNTDVASTASFATKAGTAFTTPGTSTSAALNVASYYLMNTSGAAQVIQGITAGRDGQHLTLTNVNASSVTLANNNGSATGSKIITGTGGDITLPTGGSIDLVYDSANSLWRVVSTTAVSGGYASTALSNLASTNINAALNTTAGNLTLQTTTSGNINISPVGTINLNSDTSIAAGKSISFLAGAGNFDMHLSTGSFQTGTGAVSLNGDTTIASGKNFTVTSGTTSLTGTTNVNTSGAATTTIGNAGATNAIVGTTNINVATNAVTNINTGASVGAVNIGSSTSGAVTIAANAASSFSTSTGNLSLDSAAQLQLGTGNATSLLIGKTTTTATVQGSLTVGSAAGTGTFTNNGATINTEKAYGNFATGGAMDTAANSVDKYTYFSIGQTTSGQTITLPTPTTNPTTVFGRIIHVSNIGSTSFTIGGSLILPGYTATFVWSNTDGAAAGGETWQYAGDGGGSGSYIQNQTSTAQTAGFNISGAGSLAGLLTATAGANISGAAINLNASSNFAVNIATGTTNAAVTIGNSANTTAIGSNTTYFGTTGGAIVLQATAQTSGATGNGLTVKAGTGGTGNQNGGTLTLSGGDASGTGKVMGLVSLNPTAFASSAAQTYGSSGVNTLTSGYVDTYSTIPATASVSGVIMSIPDPVLNTTVGRILYVSATTTSQDFTLRLNASRTAIDINLKKNNTATLIWNGTDWTAAGASSATDLQAAYNNTQTSAGGAEIVLNSANQGAGVTIRNSGTPITGALFEVQSSIAANLFSVNNNTTEYASNGGIESGTTSWAGISTSPTQNSTLANVASGLYSLSVPITANTQGVKNTLASTLAASTTYVVSFAVKTSGAGPYNFNTYYSIDGSANSVNCNNTLSGSGYTLTNNFPVTSSWTKVSCFITTPSSGMNSSNAIRIYETDMGASGTFYIDNLSVISNASGTTPANVQIGGGATGGQPTLFTLDQFAGPPMTNDNAAYYGSMYYDTTKNAIQCYQKTDTGGVWGACGSAPDDIVSMTPEYTGAVLNGTGVGTMTADFCGNIGSSTLQVNTSLCSSVGEARNFYRWTSPQATPQTYGIYVTYRLPSTFKSFKSGTMSLTGLIDSTSNAGVTYSVFRKAAAGGITQCSADTTNIGSAGTWTAKAPATDITASSCAAGGANAFVAGDTLIIRINVTAQSNANAYVENLTFQYSNK